MGRPDTGRQVSEKFASYIPAFRDLFDEESFYIFAFLLTIGAFLAAFIVSRYVTLKDSGHLD